MKKIKILPFIFALLIAGILMTSCKKEEEILIPKIGFASATYAISETSTSALAVKITSDIAAPAPMTITFSVAGTAVAGENYVALTTSVSVAQGATEATIFINPMNVPTIEDNKTIILSLIAANSYDVTAAGISTTITIEDNSVAANDAPVIQFTSDNAVKNAYLQDTVDVTIGLDVAFDQAMLIPITIAGDAVSGTDYEILDLNSNNEIEIASGELSAKFRVVTKYNNVADLDVDVEFAFATPTTTEYVVSSSDNQIAINIIDPTADMSAWFNEANQFNYLFAGGTSLSYRTFDEMPAYDIKRYYWDLTDNGGDYNLLTADHHFYVSATKHNTWEEVINIYEKQVGWPSVDIVEQQRYEITGGDFLGMAKFFPNEATYLKTLMKSVEGWLRFVVADPATPGEGIVIIPEQTIKLYKKGVLSNWTDKIYNADNSEYYYGWYADATSVLGDMSASTIVTPVDIVIHGAEGTFSNSSKEIIFDISFTCADVDFDIDPKYHMEKDGDTYTMRIKYINAK